MAMDSESGGIERRSVIAGVIGAELERQAHDGAQRVDIDALAGAIDTALAADEPVAADDDEGKRPDELNATNDD